MSEVKLPLDWELVLRALRYTVKKRKRKQPAWSAVMETFGLGSTYANALCKRFNIDPETGEYAP